MSRIEIVPYEPKYRDAVRRCVFETGWGGESVAPFFPDLEMFADMLVLYYTDHASDYSYIPLVDGEPAGYLLGEPDTEKYNRTMKNEIFPRILKNLMHGRYRPGRTGIRYLARGLRQELSGENTTPPLDMFPAHLHIDLFAPYRRFGLGTRLINHYLEALRALGTPGLHLGSSTSHTEALPFYEKLGFRRFAVRRAPVSYFFESDQSDFYGVWYVKSLVQP